MEPTYKQNPRFSWSDNKMVKTRRALNYENNLRKHNRNEIPWMLVSMNTKSQDLNLRPSPASEPEQSLLLNKQIIKENGVNTETEFLKPFRYVDFLQKINLRMEIMGILAFILFIISLVILGGSFEEGGENVSQCYLKFKQLGCSMVKPNDECRKYLDCLQKYGNDGSPDEGSNLKYYLGMFLGMAGWVIKRQIAKWLP